MDLHQLGTARLVPRYDKCLGCEEDYVEGCGMAVQLSPATVLTRGQNKEPKLCVLKSYHLTMPHMILPL